MDWDKLRNYTVRRVPDEPDSVLDNITTVEAIDCAYLTVLMREAGYDDITITDFNREPAGGQSYGGGLIHRFRLSYSKTSSKSAPVSIVLKESREIKSQALDPAFARREVDCYLNNL